MTTIHDTPPPDDAPEYVLAWKPHVPERWLDRPSDYVRRHWGDPWTAWCEQPPLPTPEPEPVPLRVGMEVLWDDEPSPVILFGRSKAEPDGEVVVNHPGLGWLAGTPHELTTLDGRPVCLPDGPPAEALPAPVDRPTAEAIVERCAEAVATLTTGGTIRERRYLWRDRALAAIHSVDLSDLPDPWEMVDGRQADLRRRVARGPGDGAIRPVVADPAGLGAGMDRRTDRASDEGLLPSDAHRVAARRSAGRGGGVMARRWIDVFADLVVASAMGSLAYGADGWLRVAFVVIALLLVFIAGGRTVMALIDGEDTP